MGRKKIAIERIQTERNRQVRGMSEWVGLRAGSDAVCLVAAGRRVCLVAVVFVPARVHCDVPMMRSRLLFLTAAPPFSGHVFQAQMGPHEESLRVEHIVPL